MTSKGAYANTYAEGDDYTFTPAWGRDTDSQRGRQRQAGRQAYIKKGRNSYRQTD